MPRGHGTYRGGRMGWGRRHYGGGYGWGWNAPIILVDDTPKVCETVVNGKTYYGQQVNGKCIATSKKMSSADGDENPSLSEIGAQPFCTTKRVIAVAAVIATVTVLYLIKKQY